MFAVVLLFLFFVLYVLYSSPLVALAASRVFHLIVDDITAVFRPLVCCYACIHICLYDALFAQRVCTSVF